MSEFTDFVIQELWKAINDLKDRVSSIENFTTPEPEPACQLAHDWMLYHLRDIASEIEIEIDSDWLDCDLVDDKCLNDYDMELLRMSRGE